MKKYKYAHVTPIEESTFRNFTPIERKLMYARAVLRHHPRYTFSKLYKILRWKFGSGIGRKLYKKLIKGLANEEI